jgi:catechol 2,3-dioxygenase-like lactoylglutathione lyase family enzyme
MIQHVTRHVTPGQLDDCIRFYRVLGFHPVSVPAGLEGRAVWLQHAADGPSAQVHLMPQAHARPEGGHFAIVLSDYERTVEDLRLAGHEVEQRRQYWGSPRAYVRDPAGHVVELMAWAPGAAADARP